MSAHNKEIAYLGFTEDQQRMVSDIVAEWSEKVSQVEQQNKRLAEALLIAIDDGVTPFDLGVEDAIELAHQVRER